MLRLERPIVFFDLETTGTSISEDKIVELAMLKIFPDGTKESKKTYVNPGIPIPAGATKVHGITDVIVGTSPTFKQISKGVAAFLEGCDIGGYNSNSFDVPLIMEEFCRAGVTWPEEGHEPNYVDAYQVEKTINSHKLSEVYKRYTGKDLEGAHEALNDVEATVEVLFRQLDSLGEMSPAEICEVYKGENDKVDFAGKIVLIEGVPCWSFGKNKSKPVLEDKQYADWVLRSDFSADTKNKLKLILDEIKEEK